MTLSTLEPKRTRAQHSVCPHCGRSVDTPRPAMVETGLSANPTRAPSEDACAEQHAEEPGIPSAKRPLSILNSGEISPPKQMTAPA